MQAPGKTLLKVTGIIYIVIAAFCVIAALLMFVGGSVLAAAMAGGGSESALVGGVVGGVLGVAFLIGGALYLVTGILGVKNSDKPEKYKSCLSWGIVFVVLVGFGLISQLTSQINVFSLVVSLLLLANAVLYLMGALKNKAAATMAAPKM